MFFIALITFELFFGAFCGYRSYHVMWRYRPVLLLPKDSYII